MHSAVVEAPRRKATGRPFQPGHHIGRRRKPDLTGAECNLAVAALAGPPRKKGQGERWRAAADAVNAGRQPGDRISRRTLRTRLAERGLP